MPIRLFGPFSFGCLDRFHSVVWTVFVRLFGQKNSILIPEYYYISLYINTILFFNKYCLPTAKVQIYFGTAKNFPMFFFFANLFGHVRKTTYLCNKLLSLHYHKIIKWQNNQLTHL